MPLGRKANKVLATVTASGKLFTEMMLLQFDCGENITFLTEAEIKEHSQRHRVMVPPALRPCPGLTVRASERGTIDLES